MRIGVFGDSFADRTAYNPVSHIMGDVDNRWCHLSKENNTILSGIIFDSLVSKDKNIIGLYKHNGFVYSKEITARYE